MKFEETTYPNCSHNFSLVFNNAERKVYIDGSKGFYLPVDYDYWKQVVMGHQQATGCTMNQAIDWYLLAFFHSFIGYN